MLIQGLNTYLGRFIGNVVELPLLFIEVEQDSRFELDIELIGTVIELVENGWGIEDLDFGYYRDFTLQEVIAEWYYEYETNYRVRPIIDDFLEKVLKYINSTDNRGWMPEEVISFINQLDEFQSNHERKKRMVMCKDLSVRMFTKYDKNGSQPRPTLQYQNDYQNLIQELKRIHEKGLVVIIVETLEPREFERDLRSRIPAELSDIHIRVSRNGSERKISLMKHPSLDPQLRIVEVPKSEDDERKKLLKEARDK